MIEHFGCTEIQVEWRWDHTGEVHPVICNGRYCTADNAPCYRSISWVKLG